MAEQVKIQLSHDAQATVHIDEVFPGTPSELEFSLTQSDLYAYIEPIVRRTVPVCQEALRSSGLTPDRIDDIVLVGGTTRLPLVRELVQQVFGKPAQTSINPMSVVAVGAAIQGAALLGSLVPMADGGVSVPSTAVLLDVAPRSLGVRTVGGYVDFIIERNATIPIEQTRLFTTSVDHQPSVRIQVCQGENNEFDRNHKLGEVVLSGLRHAPRGEVSIAVTFEINTDGLLEVRAIDQGTGEQQVAAMRVLGGIDEEAIEAMAERMHSD
jgi:molecular chaperone DnaK